MKVNSWTHWQPLKQVVLGNCFDTNFFDDVKDTKLRDSLHKIIDETKEDLQGIKDTLTDLGVEVIQVDKKWTNACQKSSVEMTNPKRMYSQVCVNSVLPNSKRSKSTMPSRL